jgi:phage terminase large subunit GpA-like protein
MARSLLIETTPQDVARLRGAIIDGKRLRYAPQPRLSPSEWIEQHYKLSGETSAEPGKYKFDRAPYLREIADATGDLSLEFVGLQKPAQTGYSELLKAILARCIAADPSGILLIQPTVDLAKQFNKERIKPMLRDVPVLKEMFGESSGRREYDDTLQFLGFPGGFLALQGANSPSGLASRPVRRVFSDEVGRWPESAGDEGDPFELADARNRTFWNRMHVAGSSPGDLESCRITALYESTDMRRYFVPCKDCGERFTLDWRNEAGEYLLQCEKDDAGEWLPETAFFACPHCGSAHMDSDKQGLLRGGVWVAQRPEITKRRGYRIDGLMSPWLSWPDILRKFQAAKQSIATLRVFINTVIGLPFAPPTERLSAEGLMARAEPMPTFPAWVGAFTVGCDLQADRGEALPVGFGPEQRFAIREPIRVYGTIDSPDFVREMADELAKPRDGMKPSAVAFDTGYRPEIVWKIVDELGRRGIRAYGTKGMGEPGRPLVTKPDGASTKTKRPPWTLGTHTVKDFIDARFRVDADGPLAPAFSDQLTPEEFAQLTAEEKKLTTFKGRVRRVWVQITGRRNEMLDMLGEAIFAANALGPRFIASLGQLADSRTAPVVQAETPAVTPQPDPVLAAILRSRRPAAPSRGFLKSGRR